MRVIRSMLVAAAVVGACLAGGQAAAFGSAGNPCQPSSAKRINRQDLRSIKCVIENSRMLREVALSDAQVGYSECLDEEKANANDVVWDGVDQDGSDLVSFANLGLTAAAEGDGNDAKALERYKPAYKEPLQVERLQTAIRSLTNASAYGVAYKTHMSKAGQDLQAHDCQGVENEIDPGGSTGAEGRDHAANSSESNALDALEALVK